jgi:hypothetical protein
MTGFEGLAALPGLAAYPDALTSTGWQPIHDRAIFSRGQRR